MASPWILLFACIAALASAVSAKGDQSTSAKPLGISLPVYQDIRLHPVHKLKRKRDAIDTNARVYNVSSTSYLIELDLGSPSQQVRVALDTGSSELWVNPNCEKAGSSTQEENCNEFGHYRPGRSDTSRLSETESTINYGKGQVDLQYVSDDISVPGSDIKLEEVIFGYAEDSSDLSMGILGLSFGDGMNMAYPSVIDELKEQNYTQTRAFGVALGTKDEPTGSGAISFGGVDTKKFSGDLHTMPVLDRQNDENLHRYWVQLDSIGLSTSDKSTESYDNSSMPVFFDTGATLSYLPSGVVRDLAGDLGGELDSDINLYVVPCGQNGSVDFTFDGYTIKVPLGEFIWDVGDDTCVLGADSDDEGSYILGDSFLRSVYTVYDLETPALHFAPYVNCGSELNMIPAGANATREFKGECSSDSSSATSCSSADCASESASGSSSGSGSGSSSSSSSSSGGSGGGSNSGSSDGTSDDTEDDEEDSAAGSLAPTSGAWLAIAGAVAVQCVLSLASS